MGCVVVLAAGGAILVWALHVPRADRQAIESRYETFRTALAEERLADAFAIMSPAYRQAHSLESFETDLLGYSWPRLGPGYDLGVHGSHGWLYPYESGWLDLYVGPAFGWIKEENEWFLTGEYEYYVD